MEQRLHRLAVQAGIVQDTSEYDLFMLSTAAILDRGHTFSKETMDMIRDVCEQSRYRIADDILAEMERAERPTSTARPTRLNARAPRRTKASETKEQWWETYEPKGTTKDKRPMSPLFKKSPHIPYVNTESNRPSKKRRRYKR